MIRIYGFHASPGEYVFKAHLSPTVITLLNEQGEVREFFYTRAMQDPYFRADEVITVGEDGVVLASRTNYTTPVVIPQVKQTYKVISHKGHTIQLQGYRAVLSFDIRSKDCFKPGDLVVLKDDSWGDVIRVGREL